MPLLKPDVIKNSIDELCNAHKNNSRKDNITILNHVSKLAPLTDEVPQIQMGALLCLESDIRDKEYGGKDPTRFLPLFGSTLYRDLMPHLNKLIYSMTKQEKLICMVKYYEYIQQQNLQSLEIQNPNEFKSSITSALQIILATQHDSVERLLRSMPAPHYFLQKFQNIKKEYDIYYKTLRFNLKSYIRDSDRDQMVRFLHVIFQRVMDENENRTMSREDPLYQILYGAALYILHEIETTYTYWKSDGSKLAELCRDITNLTHPSDLPANESLACYTNLFQFISNELRVSSDVDKEWEPLVNAKNYLSAINLRLFMNMDKLMKCGTTGAKPTTNDRLKNIFSYVATLAASYAASVTVGAVVTYLAKGSIGAMVTWIAGPTAGSAISWLSLASEYTTSTFLPTKISTQIGETVGSAVKNATMTQLTAAVAVAQDQKKPSYYYPAPSQLTELKDTQWIKALLKCPDAALSSKDKETIKQLFDENEFSNITMSKSVNHDQKYMIIKTKDSKDAKQSKDDKDSKLSLAPNLILMKSPEDKLKMTMGEQTPVDTSTTTLKAQNS